MILSDKQLAELTGFVRPSKQAEWLKANGFNFRLGPDGHPKILIAHVNKVMGAAAPDTRTHTEPDFSKLVA